MRNVFYVFLLSVFFLSCGSDAIGESRNDVAQEDELIQNEVETEVEFSSTEEQREIHSDEVLCIQGEEETYGDSYEDEYSQRIDTCLWGEMMIVTTMMNDMTECKFGCQKEEYYVKRGEHYKKVSLDALFNFEELLPIVNAGLKSSFEILKNDLPDCFEGIRFEDRSVSELSLNIMDDKLSFSSNTGVANYCQGPGGAISVTYSLSEVADYLRIH